MDQIDVLRHTILSLERLDVPYMLVGSYGSTIYGEPRFTQDIDIVVDLPTNTVPTFCEAFPAPEFFVSEAAVRDAVRTRFQFNVLHPASGNKIDFLLPRDDEWGRTQLSRRRRLNLFPDVLGYAASPEDIVLGKLWYYSEGGSEKHLRDIAGILSVTADVDREAIGLWANRLGYAPIWQAILDKLAQHPPPG